MNKVKFDFHDTIEIGSHSVLWEENVRGFFIYALLFEKQQSRNDVIAIRPNVDNKTKILYLKNNLTIKSCRMVLIEKYKAYYNE